ncbi:MAG: hypothetical protein ACTJHU_01510 [Mycetocola sp.]
MTDHYAAEQPHVVVVGDEAPQLHDTVAALTSRGATVSTLSSGLSDARPVTCAIVAARVDPEVSWEQWWEQSEATTTLLDSVIGRMATLSTAIVVAFGNSDTERERRRVRDAVSDMLSSLEGKALTLHGIDFTANAVEVPPSGDRALLATRLTQFTGVRSTLPSGLVVCLEDLRDTRLSSALTTAWL